MIEQGFIQLEDHRSDEEGRIDDDDQQSSEHEQQSSEHEQQSNDEEQQVLKLKLCFKQLFHLDQ